MNTMEQQQSLFLYLLPLLLSLFLYIKILSKTKRNNNKLPPGPYSLPILGNIHLLNFKKPHHSLLNLSNKYGPILLLQLGSIPTVVVSSRNIAAKIFTAHDPTFSNRPALTGITKLFYDNSSISFARDPDHWRQARKIAITELLSPRRVRSFEAVRGDEVRKLVAAIRDRESVNLSELAISLANNVVCRATLGDEVGSGGYSGEEGVWLNELLKETQSLLGGLCVGDYFPWMKWVDWVLGFNGRLEKNFEKLDGLFDRVIGEHLGDKGGIDEEKEKDLLDVLLGLHEVERMHGGYLSNIDHVKSLLVVS